MNDETAADTAAPPNHRTTSIFADGPVRRKRTPSRMTAELRIYQALMLAPTLAVCEALLRGESVPLEQLDPKWVRRFGLQP